ncbi:MAG: CotH kinase family protein [Bacteroidales bacterium]|nr:CotH kinase family protein [Bacteroidales bacterium]MCF8457272.1 CotH kinase family protein [Bacteroidales bacterium]
MKAKFHLILFFLLMARLASGQVMISEFLASNISTNVETSDYLENSDWIELHNSGTSAVDISGYFISDDLKTPNKWTIPAGVILEPGQYQLFWADGKNKVPGQSDVIYFTDSTTITISEYHLNFKLSADGEEIGLFDPEGNTSDSIIFGMQNADVSFGRNPNDVTSWVYFGEPTPGQPNSLVHADVYYEIAPPAFSVDGGFYVGSVSLGLSHPSSAATIYYTTDGSKPTTNSIPYSSLININYTKVIKARAIEPGKLPSPIITQSYFIDENSNLPVVSVSTEYGNLWSYDFGLFQNSLKNREIPISIEYFDTQGNRGFAVNAGMQLFGSTIYQLKQKPMSITLKNKYGFDAIEHQLFSDKEIYNFKNMVLRNGGNDNGSTLFLDGMVTSLVAGKMDIDYQAYQPSVVFVNGEYWGIYNIREKMNENYLADNHAVRPDNVDILENNAEVNEGDAGDYLALTSFIENNDISDSDNYGYLKSQIDINEYINYKIVKMYMGYWLADLNNKYWKEKSPDGKWRWMLFDLEHSFGRNGSDTCAGNTLQKISTNYSGLPDWSTLVFRKLCDNPEFREEFIQRSASCLNTIFEPSRVIAVIDSLKNLLSPQMPRHITRWDNDPMAIPSMMAWNINVEDMRQYTQCRPIEVRRHIMERFGLVDTFRVNIKIPASDTGRIFINNVPISDSLFSGIYFADVPIHIRATPNFGFKCGGWQGISQSETIQLILTNDTVLVPIFESDTTQKILPAHISNDTILTQAQSPYFAQSDLVVDSFATLTLEPGVKILMADRSNIIVHGNIMAEGLENNPVTIRANPAPNARVPNYNTGPRWGAMCFHNSTDTSRLSNISIENTSFGFDPKTHKAAVSGYNSNIVLDNVKITDAYHPIYTEYGSTIIRNCTLTTQLTGDIINIKYAGSAMVENCVLKGNEAEDTDAIDFDQIENGIIRSNKIYSLFGSNSDGIDLGENCSDVLIEGNEIINCTDKAISVGQASTALVRRNLIVNCAQGLGIKDSSSFAMVDQNTFYNNDYPVACFEKNLGRGGGSAQVKNSILANSRSKPIWTDKHSTTLVSYSLSNTDELTGNENLLADPWFKNAGVGNFELQDNSPCINAGDPTSPADPDGTIADMGAYYTFGVTAINPAIINEINYNSAPQFFSGDWIEIYNPHFFEIDISNWLFMDNNYENRFIFPEGTIIAAHEFLCVCNNSHAFQQQFPVMEKFVGDFKFGLDANEQLKLFDADRNLINALSYSGYSPWPTQANGGGSSLELTLPNMDNTKHINWHESYVPKGTPGFQNSSKEIVSGLVINEFMAGNSMVLADNHNEHDDWVELYYNNNCNCPINIAGLYLTDDFENPAKWQIPNLYPDSTQVDPDGHILFWADDLVEQGILHLNFRLNIEGEQIALVQIIGSDTLILDSISFGAQTVNYSYGRYPDGSPSWYEMYPTPDSTNILRKDIVFENIRLYPNPATDILHIEMLDVFEEESTISIYNPLGQEIISEIIFFDINNPIWQLNIGHIQSGIYVIEICIKGGCKTSKLVIH